MEIQTWVMLATGFGSTLITVSSIVWFMRGMKGDFDLQIAKVSGEIALVQNTVHPYAKEIEVGRARVLALTDRTTYLEAEFKSIKDRSDRLQRQIDAIQTQLQAQRK